MAQSSEEIAKEITIAWLSTQTIGAGTQAHREFSGTDADKAGEFVGEVYLAILKKVDTWTASRD